MKNEKTKIEFDYEDKHYVLELTADSLKKMERNGFNFRDLENKAVTSTEDIFCGLFIANHSDVSKAKRMEIYNALVRNADGEENEDDEDGLSVVMAEMFTEAIEEIRNRGKSGNIKWRVNKNN